MQDSTTKEKILKKIRNALIYKDTESYLDVDLESAIHLTSDEAPEIRFAQNFSELTGKFAFVENLQELSEMIWEILKEKGISEVFCQEDAVKKMLSHIDVPYSSAPDEMVKHKLTITLCECLVARTGSIVISSAQGSRRLHAYPDIHVVVATSGQIVPDIKDAFNLMKEKYGEKQPSMISFVSGPSRTADIEKTLVLGAHGPKEVYLFMMDQIPV